MRTMYVYIATCIFLLNIFSCNAQTSSLSGLSFKEGKTTVIRTVIDMHGGELLLPKNVTLKFDKGGCLKNGKVIAANTSISGYKQNIFENIEISGQWNVTYISTDMFKNRSQLNFLKNVFALASNEVDNVLKVEDGEYKVAAYRLGESILNVPSKTEVIINGSIMMEPNELTSCSIVGLNGENIKLHGRGMICGDRYTHMGTSGEWGMGVMVSRCVNVDIFDITIKDCWGDCIYVGQESTDVHINNCTLEHGRRQGVSITSAGQVLIENCVISNIGGTSPEHAIDVEPNKNDTIESVVIKNVKAVDCKGGFLAWGGATNAIIKNVELYDCYVRGAKESEYAFYMANSVKMVRCTSERNSKPVKSKCKYFTVIE